MGLTNAERQKRFRERLKAAARSGGGLTPEQIRDRDAVMAEPIYPVPEVCDQMPRFMGWNRYEWSAAPLPLVEHFGMRAAWEGWQREHAEMARRSAEISRASEQRRVDAIIAECGDLAREIWEQRGGSALIYAYNQGDLRPRKRSRRVT